MNRQPEPFVFALRTDHGKTRISISEPRVAGRESPAPVISMTLSEGRDLHKKLGMYLDAAEGLQTLESQH